MDRSRITEKAELIARQAHSEQYRKFSDNIPYIVHPERVAKKVASLPGMDEIDIAVAWLHDVLEDCGYHEWAEKIEQKCGQEVLELVKELTWPTESSEWKYISREEKNKVRFAHIVKVSDRAKRIKLVDRWDNLNDLLTTRSRLGSKYVKKCISESEQLVELIGYVDKQMADEVLQAAENLKLTVRESNAERPPFQKIKQE